jgi:hypothetical protein
MAEELYAPIIFSARKADIEGSGLDYFISMAMVAAKSARLPVCVYADHTMGFYSDSCGYFRKVIFFKFCRNPASL